tara:strand:- start:1064 stop:1249 length:186 start_codon:yes stop_codon:yes gene_type:complete
MKKIDVEKINSNESDVLDRIANEFIEDQGLELAGHSSTTSGHRSSGTHSSHSMAMKEKVKK